MPHTDLTTTGTPMTQLDAYLETLRRLFPEATVDHVRGRRPGAGGYLLFPTARNPKLLVPVSPRRAAARSMLRFSAATGWREVLVRSGAALFLRAAPARLVPDGVTVTGSGDSIVEHLSSVLGRRVDVSVGIGTARANRKPVLEVFDERGTTLAFAKVGVDEISLADVQAEADNLRRLQPLMPSEIELPQVLDASWWGDAYVLVMSSLRPRWGRSRRLPELPAAAMVAFARATRTTPETHVALAESPFWQRLGERTRTELPPGTATDRLVGAVTEATARWGQTGVEVGGWHGDWTPWNMAWSGDRLKLWDLERFDANGLVGLDALHFGVNEAVQRHGLTTDVVLRGVEQTRARSGVAAESFDLVAAAYLASVAVRYRAAAGGLRGDMITTRADRTIDALHEFLEGRRPS